jgi:hypothetical protein
MQHQFTVTCTEAPQNALGTYTAAFVGRTGETLSLREPKAEKLFEAGKVYTVTITAH